MADLWGHKRFVCWSMILTTPFLVIFVYGGGPMAFVVLALAGMLFISTFSVTIVMAQAILPCRLGMASGLMVGFAVGTGGIGVTFLGMIADHWGIPAAMKAILILPVIGFFLSLLIQYPPKPRRDQNH